MELKFKLLIDYDKPTGIIRAGVVKTESEWMKVFPDLENNDCAIKTDWFECVGCTLTTSESKCNLQNVTNSNFVVKIDDTTAFGCFHHNHDKHRVYIDGLKYDEALMLQKIITNVIS